MFIRKQVIVFFIMVNFASSFCGTVPVDGDLLSEEVSELSDSSAEDGIAEMILIISAFLHFFQSLFVTEPEQLNPNNNSDTKMELVGWVSDSNEDSENSFEKSVARYTSNSEWDSSSSETSEENVHEITVKNLCSQKDQSGISHSDIKYLIEEKAEILNIKEKIENSYYLNAADIITKHKDDIEEFKERFLERPGHMLHVLDSITSWREGLDPKVEEIEAQLQQIQTLEDNLNDVAKASEVTLNRLDKYKKLCAINCEEISIENRYGDGIYCIRLKELNDYINEKLSDELTQYGKGLGQPLEVKDQLYEKTISDLKNNLTKAAVHQFGMTMYNILSLQDDYHHFVKDLENEKISSKIHNIIETTAEIDFIRIGLKRDLDKYRQYCMKCGNQRVKRNVVDYYEDSLSEDLEDYILSPEEIKHTVDELIQAKIDEIRDDIANNITAMFSELDEMVNDHDVIDRYVRELHKIQDDIDEGITDEKEAFLRLKSRIPEELIDKITDLSQQSRKLIQDLESAKLFIDQFKLK